MFRLDTLRAMSGATGKSVRPTDVTHDAPRDATLP